MENVYKPILFSTSMVLANIDGRKTQTRRTKGLETINEAPDEWLIHPQTIKSDMCVFSNKGITEGLIVSAPYKKGNILWVRESFYAYGIWIKNGKTKTGKRKTKFVDHGFVCPSYYKYVDNPPVDVLTDKNSGLGFYKRNSLFMPKGACRIFLKVKSVKCERLRDIFHSDARAEGIDFIVKPNPTRIVYYNYLTKVYDSNELYSFMTLWQSIHGEPSWAFNPWVWVIEYERIEKPLDFIV